MRKRIRLIQLASLLLMTVHATCLAGQPKVMVAQPQASQEVSLDFTANVQPDGTSSDILPDVALPPEVQELVRKRVSSWRYEPAQWQGKPIVQSISQRIIVEPVSTTSGGYVLRIKRITGVTRQAAGESIPDGTKMSPPVFPNELRRRGIGGTLVYAILLDESGKPLQVDLLSPADPDSDFKLLDQSARKAIATWKMYPPKAGEVPIRCWIRLPLQFSVVPGTQRAASDQGASLEARSADMCPKATLTTQVVGTTL